MHVLIRGGWFGRGGVSKRLERATVDMKRWCKVNLGKMPSLSKFSADNLCLKKDCFPASRALLEQLFLEGFVFVMFCNIWLRTSIPCNKELRAKGYDAYLILKWLSSILRNVEDPKYEVLESLLSCADMFATMLCKGPLFFSMEEARALSIVGEGFLKLYLQCATEAPHVYKLRPKWHMVHHLVLEPLIRPSHRNPASDSTWMDEDFIKRIGRLIRRTHRRTSAFTCLQMYLILLKQKLRLFEGWNVVLGLGKE